MTESVAYAAGRLYQMENSEPGVLLHNECGPSQIENIPSVSHVIVCSEPKPRMRWTPELHKCFVNAVSQLGGPDKATPKSVMRVMGVKGITLYHLKSHLQKFRLGRHPHKEESIETNEDEGSLHGGGLYIVSQDTDNRLSQKEPMQIAKALQAQIEVQKRLEGQLELQRLLQVRIESEGRYLKTILEKAQETLASKTSASAGLEAAQAELADLASRVLICCTNTEFSKQLWDAYTAYKKLPTIYCSSQTYVAGLVGKDDLEQSGNECRRPNSRKYSRTHCCEDIGAARIQKFGVSDNNGCISRTEEQLSLAIEDRSVMHSISKPSESSALTDETKYSNDVIPHAGTDSLMQGIDIKVRSLMQLAVERLDAKIPLSDEGTSMLAKYSNLTFQDCLAGAAAVHTSQEHSPASILENCRKTSEALDLNVTVERDVPHQGREFDLNAYGWGN